MQKREAPATMAVHLIPSSDFLPRRPSVITVHFQWFEAQLLTRIAYQVTSLPEVPFDIGEMYAGNIPINTKDLSRQLYYVFQPTVGAPVDEITIWLNGGPGTSSSQHPGYVADLSQAAAL
jgi:hypothetical protein